jgi:hypothetical protein
MSGTRQQTQAAVAVITLALAAVAVNYFLSDQPPPVDTQRKPAITETDALPVPELPATPYLNVSAEATYVGSRKCAECHAEEAATFSRSRHNRSMTAQQTTELPDAEFDHPESGYSYSTFVRGGQLVHTEAVEVGDQTVSARDALISWVMGSGRFGHSFLTSADGFLLQSPLTWYSTRDCWDMSPGYDHENQMSFRRSVSARCLFCHAGIFDVIDDNEFHVQVHEPSIGCERCHGPGSLHVDWHEGAAAGLFAEAGTPPPGEAPADYSIVNPAKLDRVLGESVCQQCHLQGDTQILVRGRDFDSFRPGLPLSLFRQEYRMSASGDMTIVGHVEQMQQSLCYTNSESLTCTTCHDPHEDLVGPQLDLKYRNACLSCHQDQHCTEDLTVRESAENKCVQCHMPSAPTEVPHVAFTHHRIGIHRPDDRISIDSGDAEPLKTLQLLALQPRLKSDADEDRSRGLAWVKLYLSNPAAATPETLPKAQKLLQSAWEGGARDAGVAAGLAQIAVELGWDSDVEHWAGITLEMDENPSEERMSALANLGDVQFRRGSYFAALQSFTELTRHRRDTRHWFYRGLCEQNLGQTDAAIVSLNKALECNPAYEGIHAALAAVYELQGKDDLAQEHRRLLQLLSND